MRNLPDNVLDNPTEAAFRKLLARILNLRTNIAKQSLGGLGLTLDRLQGSEGYFEIAVVRMFSPGERRHTREAATFSWWTNPAGIRYIRVDGYARVGESSPSKRFYGVPRPWAAVFLERAEELERARSKRLDKLITRVLGGPEAPKLVVGEQRPEWLKHPLPDFLECGRLAAASEDGLLIIDSWDRPKRAGLIFQSASGTYRLHNVPVHFADRKSAGFKKAGTSATRVRAAITWLLAQHLDGKEP
jgi:hypothetical protein